MLNEPLTRFRRGFALPVIGVENDWFLIRFDDPRWGKRVGFVQCADVIVSASAVATARPPSSTTPGDLQAPLPESDRVRLPEASLKRNETSQSTEPRVSRGKAEHFAGYLEWRRDDYLVVDGQRIRWDDRTRVKLGRVSSIANIPLGYEINVRGARTADGSVLAQQLDAKPNGIAAYENEVRRGFDDLEADWMRHGAVMQFASNGTLPRGCGYC